MPIGRAHASKRLQQRSPQHVELGDVHVKLGNSPSLPRPPELASDSLVQWGPSGAPQPLSSALRADNISGHVAPGAGQPTGGNATSTYGSGFGSAAGAVSEDGGRGGDDDTSEEEQGNDYRVAALQRWSGQGDDSEKDVSTAFS